MTGALGGRVTARIVLAPTVAAVWHKHRYARLAVLVLGFLNVALGVVLVIGGPRRVSAASFATIRDTPGGAVTWGIGLLVIGAAVLGSSFVSRAAVAWALGAAALAHLFLAGGFVVAAIENDDGALTGPIVYIGLSACHAVQCLLHRRPVPLAR